MRFLKNLIPEDTRDSLNANPTFQWFVVILMVVIGAFLVYKGVDAVRNKRVTVKGGRVYEGTSAQVLGVVYSVLGAITVLFALAVKLAD